MQNERWHYFDAHSRLSSNTKDELINNLNSSISVSHQSISKASHIVITLGSAWVYRHIASDAIVANCHKVPQKKFLKELLSIDEITNSLEAIVSLIRAINDKIAFIFTISPIRHLKDGVVENNRSKAHLLAAVHQVVNPRKQIHYFPAYEIVMDELRDYRFYSEDMIHPNQIAINYIWERFNEVWLSQDSNEIMKFVDDIQKGNKHKPFNKSSESHQLFLKKLKEKEEFVQILMAKQKSSKN